MGILVQLSTPAPNTITQSLTATGTIQWAAGSLFYLPEGLLVEAVFVSEGEAVQEGDKIAALRREDVEHTPNAGRLSVVLCYIGRSGT
jgi:multidrug efflux pump subunit AcrA (membrane-fusion protein)